MVKAISKFSADFLNNIKDILSKEKERLVKELAKFTTKNPHVADDYNSEFPDYGDKDDENAAEVAEYATNLPLEESLEKSLRDVNKSLDRIGDGTYGVCKYCKNPIDEKRLLARPTSSACVECKKTITQEL
ncbi:MAG: TraR/DksA family transcriptional regulator [Candidatus Magasanikbacteria bacterium]|jgi:DnaK suppressor protein